MSEIEDATERRLKRTPRGRIALRVAERLIRNDMVGQNWNAAFLATWFYDVCKDTPRRAQKGRRK